MKKHLAIFTKDAIDRIFAGLKTVEIRFSQKRIPPFGVVNIGDLVYIKPPGQEIVGQFLIKQVISFEGLGKDEWQMFKQNYGQKLSFGSQTKMQEFFEKRKLAKFATLIFMDQVEQFITSPVKIKKSDLRGWMILG